MFRIFGRKAARAAELERLDALRIIRPTPAITGVDGAGELISNATRPVYTFKRLTDVSDATRARDAELIERLLELERC